MTGWLNISSSFSSIDVSWFSSWTITTFDFSIVGICYETISSPIALLDLLTTNSVGLKKSNDIVEKLYTRPIKYYKPSAFSRFRETYKLMREREKAPFLKCFSLALELFGMYNLHPAIITACKNLDQLDIYLACLEDNTLSDFHFFDIKFEVRPSIY